MMENQIETWILFVIMGFIVAFVVGYGYQTGLLRPSRLNDQAQSSGHHQQTEDWIVFYASQRGRAKTLAYKTADALMASGQSVKVEALSEIRPPDLCNCQQALFITSTFGSGQAPESARKFERQLKKTELDLSALRYAVLGLGDKNYDRFCGFARTLDRWLQQQGAQHIHTTTLVSQMDKSALILWTEFLQRLGADTSNFFTK